MWREIFGREVRNLDPELEAAVDGRFLVMLSTLQDVAGKHLAALKKAVAETNGAYRQYVEEQTTAREDPKRGSNEERKAVDDLAESLDFQ